MLIPRKIVPDAVPAEISPAAVARELDGLVRLGARLRPAGEARKDPLELLHGGYRPRFKLELFGTRLYFTGVRKNPAIRYFVAYVVPPQRPGRPLQIYPRIFYKDLSLIWRAVSHMISTDNEFWIGKGAVREDWEDDHLVTTSVESTTDLPLELQPGIEQLNRRCKRVPVDEDALYLILRNAPDGRVEPYREFTAPREAAAADRRNLIHGGRSIARLTRPHDPTSLRVVKGFEPDFKNGILSVSPSRSTLYGGVLNKYRILSINKKIQYWFMAAPEHVWIIPPQATTTELSSFGVRTVDVVADEDLFVPGFEYHFLDEAADPPEMFSQIPEGFAGNPNDHDPARADASPWLDRLPWVKQFRQQVLRIPTRR